MRDKFRGKYIERIMFVFYHKLSEALWDSRDNPEHIYYANINKKIINEITIPTSRNLGDPPLTDNESGGRTPFTHILNRVKNYYE